MDFVQKQRRRALAILLTLPTSAGTAAAQVIYNGEAVLPDQPLVSSTYQGTTIYQVGQTGTGYDKSGTSVTHSSIVYDKSGTSHSTGGGTFYSKGTTPTVVTTGATLDSQDPASVYLNNVGQRIADHQDSPQVPSVVFEDSDDDGDDAVASVSPGFTFLGGDDDWDDDDETGTVTIRATDPLTALSGDNKLRLSLGYGFANTGDFFYGTDSPYISTSAASADWPSAGDTYLNSAAVSEDLSHRGLRAMLRADVSSFFVDGAFGSYQIEDQTSQRTYNLAEAAEDQATATVRVGPQFWAIDGDGTAEFGSFTAIGDAVSGTEYDSLLVKTTINSTLTDVGGAAGFNLQLSSLPIRVGLGLGLRSIQRTTVARIDGDYTIATTGEVTDTDFPDHTYTQELTGLYAGPVVRVNYDSDLGGKLGAHFGGSLQALYGRSALTARQAFSTETNTFETTDTGFMLGVEAEAGLSYQITPALTLGVGVYGTLTQGAPEVAAAVDPAATKAATQQPSLKGGSWSEMGLKGSISTAF